MIQFTAVQLVVIGLAASVIVYLMRLVYELGSKKKFSVPDWVQVVVVYVVSLLLAVLWFPQTLPPLPVMSGDILLTVTSILTYAGLLLSILTAYTTSATAIYVLIIQKVKVGLGQAIMPLLYPKPLM